MSRCLYVPLVGLVLACALTACLPKPAPEPPAAPENNSVPGTEEPPVALGPVEKPVPPLQLPVPKALAEQLDGNNLREMTARELLGRANQAMADEDYPRAAAFQYWYFQKAKTGQYNLACFLAQTGQIEPAFYWLQIAAIEEGVDSLHALQDADLTSLRRDRRWGVVQKYLVACNKYFESAALSHTILVLPKGYQKNTPIPAVIWLHGLGSRPEDFVGDDSQVYADKLNVALIGASGTSARGPRSFVWADDPEKDAQRLSAALMEVADRVTIRPGRVITFGFSQGAQVGLEVAVRNPEVYAGSIVLSPGAMPHLEGLKPSPLLAQRGFVVSCGANEHPGNLHLTALDGNWLRQARAQVIQKLYPGVSAHTFPEDFEKRFPEWVKFILKARGD